MRRLAITMGVICSIALTSVFFQNCSRYNPELNASSNYTAKAESIADNSQDAALGAELQVTDIASVQQSKEISSEESFSLSFSLPSKRLNELVSFYCRIDSATWKICQSPLLVENLADGSHQLSIKAV